MRYLRATATFRFRSFAFAFRFVFAFAFAFVFAFVALLVGLGSAATSPRTAILLVALLTAASGLIVTGTSWRPQRTLDPLPIR